MRRMSTVGGQWVGPGMTSPVWGVDSRMLVLDVHTAHSGKNEVIGTRCQKMEPRWGHLTLGRFLLLKVLWAAPVWGSRVPGRKPGSHLGGLSLGQDFPAAPAGFMFGWKATGNWDVPSGWQVQAHARHELRAHLGMVLLALWPDVCTTWSAGTSSQI